MIVGSLFCTGLPQARNFWPNFHTVGLIVHFEGRDWWHTSCQDEFHTLRVARGLRHQRTTSIYGKPGAEDLHRHSFYSEVCRVPRNQCPTFYLYTHSIGPSCLHRNQSRHKHATYSRSLISSRKFIPSGVKYIPLGTMTWPRRMITCGSSRNDAEDGVAILPSCPVPTSSSAGDRRSAWPTCSGVHQ